MAPFDHTGTLIVMANPDSHELVCASSTAASHRCGAIFWFPNLLYNTGNSSRYTVSGEPRLNLFLTVGSRDTHGTDDTQTCLPVTWSCAT